MNPYGGMVRLAGRTRGFAWVASRILPPLDRPFRGRRRSPTSLGSGFPLCYLTTVGRRSGEARTVALLHVAEGDRVILIASNFGRRNHPGWSLNLLANSEAIVAVDGVERAMRSRLTTAEESERYWAEALRFWPGYEGYLKRAGREIRLFVLEPSE